MIPLVIFLAIGALLFFALLYFLMRSPDEPATADPLLEARHAIQALESGLLPPQLTGRIFARGDWDYVSSCGSPQVCEIFLRERRKIALSWVGLIQTQIVALRRFHRVVARQHANLSFRSEAALAFDFATLLLACRALQLLLFLRGPLTAPRVVGATVAAAIRVCEASKQSMAFLAPASIAPAGSSLGGGAAS